LLLCSVPASAQAVGGSGAVALELLNRIRAQDFNGASAMFHYPASQSKAEREADRAGVAKWIRTLSAEIGPLQGVQAQQGQPRAESVLTISVAGGDVQYWASQGKIKTTSHTFLASWKTEWDSRLIVHTLQTRNGLEIQSLHFGVPTTRADANAFMTA